MKKLRNIFLFVLSFSIIIGLLCTIAYAHSGKTDEYGGHYDNSTGEYHYHHGYPAHQHTNGICPYDFDDKSEKNNDISSNTHIVSNRKNTNKIIVAITVIIALFDFVIFTVFWKFTCSDGTDLEDFFDYIKALIYAYFLAMLFSIPTIIIGVIIDSKLKLNFDSDKIVSIIPFYTAFIFIIIAGIVKLYHLIISKIKSKYKNKKIIDDIDNDKEKYIVKGWKGENLNTYNTGVKPTNSNNDIDIFNYIDNESNIINLTAFITDLMNKYLKNSDFGFSIHKEIFIREILYFSQLSVLNSFKKIYHLDIRENEFLSASRYLVGITMSIPQPYLLFNEPEKENIEALNKSNQFNKDDIDILCKILFVAYHKGYATLDYMLSLFDQVISETDIKDYYKFKNICENYIYKLASQLTLLRQHEITRTEKNKLNRDDTDYDNCKYSLKETPTFYIM